MRSCSPPEQPRNGASSLSYQFWEDEPQKCANSSSVLGFSLIVYSMLYSLSHCSQQLHKIDCQYVSIDVWVNGLSGILDGPLTQEVIGATTIISMESGEGVGDKMLYV